MGQKTISQIFKRKKMKKKKFFLKDGCWYDQYGVCFPFIARIKPDYCLSIEEIRQEFPPHSFVYYCLNEITVEKIEDTKIYFACVRSLEGCKCHKLPLAMLEFTDKQKEEILRVKKFPKSVFEKRCFAPLNSVHSHEVENWDSDVDFFEDFL